MKQQRKQSSDRESRLTPWVGRILLANAAVAVLLATVLTAPWFLEVLQFDPHRALQRPWTFLTYQFVHGGVLHLGVNLLLLLVFGPSVERRLGGGTFFLYYLYCGVGAAAFALGLSSFTTLPPMLGATGAAFGTALAFVLAWPDADAVLSPLPLRISARALLLLLVSANLLVALSRPDGAAHFGYLGGLAAGYIFFRLQTLVTVRRKEEPRSIARRPVMAPIPVRQGGTITEVRPARARPEAREEYPADEVDRVLDKISAFGIQSLTAEERRFLDDVSKRKRKDLH